MYIHRIIVVIVICFVMISCATYNTEITGGSGLSPNKTLGADPVDVLFISRHLVQTTQQSI